jgi:hypothetical protein
VKDREARGLPYEHPIGGWAGPVGLDGTPVRRSGFDAGSVMRLECGTDSQPVGLCSFLAKALRRSERRVHGEGLSMYIH